MMDNNKLQKLKISKFIYINIYITNFMKNCFFKFFKKCRSNGLKLWQKVILKLSLLTKKVNYLKQTVVLLGCYLLNYLILIENYLLMIIFTTDYFTKVFFNLSLRLNKISFYLRLLKYSLTYNKLNKVILTYFYKNVKLEKKEIFSNSVEIEVLFNPYMKKKFFFSNLTQNLYFNDILLYSTTIVNAKNIIYILFENVNKLFINEKVLIYFRESTILNCIDNDYNNINFFDNKDRQYLFKKNLVLLEKQYGPFINTYIYVNYLFTSFYLNDESLENLEINLNDFFVTKSSLQFFIQYCLTCKLKDEAFYNCLFLILKKVKTINKIRLN